MFRWEKSGRVEQKSIFKRSRPTLLPFHFSFAQPSLPSASHPFVFLRIISVTQTEQPSHCHISSRSSPAFQRAHRARVLPSRRVITLENKSDKLFRQAAPQIYVAFFSFSCIWSSQFVSRWWISQAKRKTEPSEPMQTNYFAYYLLNTQHIFEREMISRRSDFVYCDFACARMGFIPHPGVHRVIVI